MSSLNHRWSWFELMSANPEAAKSFYNAVLGFTYSPWPGMDYTIISTAAGRGIAGVMQAPPEMAAMGVPSAWMGVVRVADADVAAARCVELGGAIAQAAFDIPNVGRYAGLKDAHGAHFGVMSSVGAEAETVPEAELGSMCWAELWTADPVAALGFYGALFGWEKQHEMEMGELGTYRTYRLPGDERAMGGISALMPGQPAPAWLYYFSVASVETAVAAIQGAGGKVVMGPQEVPGGGKLAIAVDPFGAAFAVYSM